MPIITNKNKGMGRQSYLKVLLVAGCIMSALVAFSWFPLVTAQLTSEIQRPVYQQPIINQTINSSLAPPPFSPPNVSTLQTVPANPLSLPSYQPTTPAITILGHSYWFDNSNRFMGPTLYIVGEALNQSPSIVSSVKVVATLYDSSNKIVGTDSTYLDISNNLYPNSKSPFKIVITNSDTSFVPAVSSYSLAVDWY